LRPVFLSDSDSGKTTGVTLFVIVHCSWYIRESYHCCFICGSSPNGAQAALT